MFNGRTFYGLQLGITMDKGSSEDTLPRGLRDLGPGLGKNGKPVTNIAVQYDRLVKKKSTLINSLLFVDVDEYTANVASQNVVFNPFNLVQDFIRGVEIRNYRPVEHVPGLPIQNIISPHAPNLMHDAVTSVGLNNIPNTSVPPTNVLQNANVHCNPSQPHVMAQNALQPQGLWHNNEYQPMPPVPSVPNQAIQAPMPDMIPNMDVAQNQDWQFISQPPPIINGPPNSPRINVGGNTCVADFRRDVAFQNVPNPVKFAQPEAATVGQNNVFPNASNPIIEITPPEIRNTVVLNNVSIRIIIICCVNIDSWHDN
ncbi:hypothetical protein O3G_MSEX004250 [Manduca sexta]|uniref:Uncharacterized protein n=1 Tax=Manduca sexta TaxID=7130 RepID=A0A921YVF6_MANSE|nr:hypothetical protein O3G_MSEX004250 [Manduca sexta]KAG6446096.1 hypothetical protein O3G_MSEX004250 [Manduca sexta]